MLLANIGLSLNSFVYYYNIPMKIMSDYIKIRLGWSNFKFTHSEKVLVWSSFSFYTKFLLIWNHSVVAPATHIVLKKIRHKLSFFMVLGLSFFFFIPLIEIILLFS